MVFIVDDKWLILWCRYYQLRTIINHHQTNQPINSAKHSGDAWPSILFDDRWLLLTIYIISTDQLIDVIWQLHMLLSKIAPINQCDWLTSVGAASIVADESSHALNIQSHACIQVLQWFLPRINLHVLTSGELASDVLWTYFHRAGSTVRDMKASWHVNSVINRVASVGA